MRFLFLAPWAAALLCLNLAAAGSPYPDIAYPTFDNLNDDQRYFVDACRATYRPDAIESAKRSVPLEIASAEFMKAFFNNRPEVVKALLKVKGVELMVSEMIFRGSMSDAVSRHVDTLETFFAVHERDQPRYHPTFDYMKSTQMNSSPQKKNDASTSSFRIGNGQYYFTVKGALALACHLRNPEMVEVLLRSSYLDPGLQDFCVHRLTDGVAPVIDRSRWRDSWGSRGDDDISGVFLALFDRVDFRGLHSLVAFAAQGDRREVFEIAFRHPRFDTPLLPIALMSAVAIGNVEDLRRLLTKPFEHVDGVSDPAVYVVGRAARRGDEFLTILLKHLRWKEMGEKDRSKVVRDMIMARQRPIEDIISHFATLKVSVTKLIDILSKLVETERDFGDQKKLEDYLSEVKKYNATLSPKERFKEYMRKRVINKVARANQRQSCP